MQQALLEHAQRQTRALENIHSVLLVLLGLAVVGAVFYVLAAGGAF